MWKGQNFCLRQAQATNFSLYKTLSLSDILGIQSGREETMTVIVWITQDGTDLIKRMELPANSTVGNAVREACRLAGRAEDAERFLGYDIFTGGVKVTPERIIEPGEAILI